MLRRHANVGRIADSPYAPFLTMTRERDLLPYNPTKITAKRDPLAMAMDLGSGRKKVFVPARFLAPEDGESARRSTQATWQLEFGSGLPMEFMQLLRSFRDQAKPIAIFIPEFDTPVGGTPVHRSRLDEPWWDDTTQSWYTNNYPWVPGSEVLYDESGNIVYQAGLGSGSSTINTLLVTTDASQGRIQASSGNQPSNGRLYADYDRLIYGCVTALEEDAAPFGSRERYAARVTIEEVDFPAAVPYSRLHLQTGTIPVAVAETASTTSDYGLNNLFGGTPTAGRALPNALPPVTFPPDLPYVDAVIPSGLSLSYLFGIYVSDPLVAQVLAEGMQTVVVTTVNMPVSSEVVYRAAFCYLYRDGIGKVASLSGLQTVTVDATPVTEHPTSFEQSCFLAGTLPSSLRVETGDRIIVELWIEGVGGTGYSIATFKQGQDGIDRPPQTMMAAYVAGALFAQFSNPLYFVSP